MGVPGLGSLREGEHTHQPDDSAALCLQAVFMLQLQAEEPMNILAESELRTGVSWEATEAVICVAGRRKGGSYSEKVPQLLNDPFESSSSINRRTQSSDSVMNKNTKHKILVSKQKIKHNSFHIKFFSKYGN